MSPGKTSSPVLLFLVMFGGCKITVGDPVPSGAVHVTYTIPPMARLEDVPLKTRPSCKITVGVTEYAEQPCKKVLAKMKRNVRKLLKKPRQKLPRRLVSRRRLRKLLSRGVVTLADAPVPLNHSKPLDTIADAPHASVRASAGRLDVLRNQTDEQDSPHHGVVQENVEENVVVEAAWSVHADTVQHATPV
ncbi:hypothetical protein Tco_0523780 [Tanacetum coccineum]